MMKIDPRDLESRVNVPREATGDKSRHEDCQYVLGIAFVLTICQVVLTIMTSGYVYLLFAVAAAVLVFNIPFGFWRDSVRKFSLPWLLAIHLPIPFIIGLRIVTRLGWHLSSFPVIIGSFILGQFLGGRLHRVWLRKHAAAKS